jgi:hypothetical protein
VPYAVLKVQRFSGSRLHRVVISASRLSSGIHPPCSVAELPGLPDWVVLPLPFSGEPYHDSLLACLVAYEHQLKPSVRADQVCALRIYCVDQVAFPDYEVGIKPSRAALLLWGDRIATIRGVPNPREPNDVDGAGAVEFNSV